MQYRPEIDGLRAVSVTAVVLFHAGIAGFAGGFVGVDVFFVISGFLITQILASELAAGNFSILRFYERRARRILPALYLVLGVSCAAALWLMLPGNLTDFSRSVMATLLFVSNIWFWWRGADYFSPDLARDPMLHTWSLGVEEQYYLIVPLLMLLLWRLGRRQTGPRRLAIGIAALSLASLMLAEIGWRIDPAANFYLLPSRLWQIGFGALGALVWLRRPPVQAGAPGGNPGLPAELAAAAGLVLVVGSIFAMDETIPFPSLYAVLPTGGALLVLLYATRATVVGRLLALRPMVAIGLVSYSAYLWHQPLLAFARIASPEPLTLAQKFGLVALTFLLAWITLVLVEQPFRDRRFLSQRQIFAASALGGLVLLVAAGSTFRLHGYRDFWPETLRSTVVLTSASQGSYVRAAYDAHGPGDFVAGGGPKLLIIGDSFSQDFYNMIRETGSFPGWQIALRYVLARCQIYLGPEDISPLLDPGDRARCAADPSAADFTAIAHQADIVIFAISWRDWAAARLPETIANFHFRPDQTVLVLGRKHFTQANRPMLAGRSPAELAALRLPSNDEHLAITATLRRVLPPAQLVDAQALICDAAGCPIATPGGALISLDGAHLTPPGAAYIGSLLFADPHLARFAGPRAGVPTPAGPPTLGSDAPLTSRG